MWWGIGPWCRGRGFRVCGYGGGRSPVGFVSAKNRTEEQGGTPVPAISAGAPKRMLGLPANVVTGTPRIEKDRIGGDLVIGPVRPDAKDMGRCAGCGGHGRPHDRLPARRWRHLDIGCTRLLLEHAPRSAVSALMRVDWKSVGPRSAGGSPTSCAPNRVRACSTICVPSAWTRPATSAGTRT